MLCIANSFKLLYMPYQVLYHYVYKLQLCSFIFQCGQGNTDDVLIPTCVSSILGVKMQNVGAGLWHTVCTSIDGDVYSFGGNQFGQLGTGSDQAEV
jgi:alpha-tubulin suppressor-like RCC1 family protein